MSANPTAAPASPAPAKAKREKLPAIERFYASMDALTAGQGAAKKLGHKAKRVKRFTAKVGDQTYYLLASSKKDVWARLGQGNKISGVTIDGHDVSEEAVAPTPDSILSAMSMLSEADQKKVREAMEKAKAGKGK